MFKGNGKQYTAYLWVLRELCKIPQLKYYCLPNHLLHGQCSKNNFTNVIDLNQEPSTCVFFKKLFEDTQLDYCVFVDIEGNIVYSVHNKEYKNIGDSLRDLITRYEMLQTEENKIEKLKGVKK